MPDCGGDSGEAPRIASPLRRVTYALRPDPGDEAISLEAATAGDVHDLFWFDGNELIGNGASQKALAWRPVAEGMHLIRVIDDHGRVAERDVEVQFTR
jgi:membrane carboxypeptidase/penicillin-binding protein PbpC